MLLNRGLTVPHLKALLPLRLEPDSQGYGSTFRACHTHLKNAILLNISLVGDEYFLLRLYIVIPPFLIKHVACCGIDRLQARLAGKKETNYYSEMLTCFLMMIETSSLTLQIFK